ncbi:hypothetical protein A6769_04610 [Nostoc punctiforme NIES-2108]|uniref:Uncharacterized protein n=1 Tax=Nostoc punctiforme NIES-2108 TaxID=1356359 RepID=A0A367RW11_NOSPU|nr:hypothetical protein A6769_04610 [Nostoc punctiforme NIES-2108]
MPFSDFTNPYQNPANIPQKYRQHINLLKLFKADGSYVRPAEDPVTMWALEILVEEYGVPLEAMELELSSDFSEGTHQGGRRYQGRADLVVYDDRYADSVGNLDVAFIMVEAMEPSKKVGGTEGEGWVDHLNRLNAYMSASPSARYAILTSGKHTVIYRRDLEYPRKLEIIGDLQKYESAREAAKHSFYTVILNPSEPDGIQTGLTPLTRDKFREVLGDTRSGCHSILRDNEGLQPQEAVDAMVKFLFAKWYDEQATIDLVKQTGESRAYVFSARNVMHVARVNTLMNGAQYADLKVMDSLERLGSITGGITEGLPERPGFYLGGLTMILTNPPFGSKLTNENVLKDFAGRDGVSKNRRPFW